MKMKGKLLKKYVAMGVVTLAFQGSLVVGANSQLPPYMIEAADAVVKYEEEPTSDNLQAALKAVQDLPAEVGENWMARLNSDIQKNNTENLTTSNNQVSNENPNPDSSSIAMYPETATPVPTQPDDNTIVHLIDVISGKEVGTVTMGQWLEAFKADYNGVVLPGGYRNANWRSDAQGGPEISRTQAPDYEYPVISTAEYENEINHATVVVHYIDEETNAEVGTWTYLVGGQVGYLPGDYKNLPLLYRVDTNKAEENIKLDNGQISRKVYLLKMQASATPAILPSSQSSESSSSASQSSSSVASSSISASSMASSAQVSTTTSASSSAVKTTSQSSNSNTSKAKALPTTADNAKQSFIIMLIGLLLSVFSYIFYQMRKRIFR
jgi:hypothetical protein